MNILQIAKFTFKSSIGSPGGFPQIFLALEKTASMQCDVSGDMWRWWSHVASVFIRLSCSAKELAPCTRGLSRTLFVFGNRFLFVDQVPAAALSESSESSSSWCDGSHRCSFINPPKYASLSRTWDVDAASNEFGSILILLSVFPEAIGIPGLLDAIGLDAAEELVDTTLSSSFLILNLLRHCGAAYQAEIGPCFIDHFFLVSDFRQLPCRNSLQFFPILPILSLLLLLHLDFFNAWGIGMNLWTRLWWVIEFVPFAVMWSWWGLCPAPSSLGLVLSSASTTQTFFVLHFPIFPSVFPLLLIGILQGIAAGIGTSNFLRAAIIVSLIFSSFG